MACKRVYKESHILHLRSTYFIITSIPGNEEQDIEASIHLTQWRDILSTACAHDIED